MCNQSFFNKNGIFVAKRTIYPYLMWTMIKTREISLEVSAGLLQRTKQCNFNASRTKNTVLVTSIQAKDIVRLSQFSESWK